MPLLQEETEALHALVGLCSAPSYIPCLPTLVFETGSQQVSYVGLKLAILLPLSDACTTTQFVAI